jgi:Fic-DOC domain mobile mystery protein B
MIQRFEFPEGATPILDCSGLIPIWVHHCSDLNRVEAENIMKAQRKFLRGAIDPPQNWFRVDELQNIHREMFKNVWEWAGKYRKSMTSIGIKPNLIPIQLGEFCLEVLSWFQYPTELTFVEMAARVHHRLVSIHPFENGNGRFSRLIADRFLLACRCLHPIWPAQLNREGVARKDYIQTLKSADQGDYVPLIELMKKLGGSDPKLSDLLGNNSYRVFVQNNNGSGLVKAMLRNGENPNSRSENEYYALHSAIKAGLDEIVKLLVDAGAEIEAKDRNGLTALQIAEIHGNTDVVDFLLLKGAQESVKL